MKNQPAGIPVLQGREDVKDQSYVPSKAPKPSRLVDFDRFALEVRAPELLGS